MKKFLILFIIILALALRLPGIVQGNFAFTYDTGRDLLAVRDLVTRGDISLIGPTTGLMGVFYGPWWYWFLVFPFVVFGGNPTGMTSWIAILGAVAAAVAYWWGTKNMGGVFGSILGILLAGSPAIASMTSQLWNPDMLILLTVGVIMLLRDLRSLTPVRLVLFGFLLALLIEFEIVYGILFMVGFAISLPLWHRKDVNIQKIGWIGAGIFVVQAPRILFELRNAFIQTRSLFSGMVGGQNLWQIYTKRDWLFYGSFASVFPREPWVQNTLILAVLCVFFIFWKRISGKNRRFLQTLLTIIAVFALAIFLYPRDFWHYYLFGLPVLYAVLVSFSISLLWKVVPKITAVFVVAYLFFLIQPFEIVRSVIHPRFVGDAAVYHNQDEVVRFIFRESGLQFKYITYTPPQIDYTWKYLFEWYAKRYPDRLTEMNPDLMYVILEPDPGYPDRRLDWLGIRKRDGVTVAERMFSSGIEVQARRLRWD